MKKTSTIVHSIITFVSVVVVALSPSLEIKYRIATDSLSSIARGWPIPFTQQQFVPHGTDINGVPQFTSHLGNINILVGIINVVIVWVLLELLVLLVLKKRIVDTRPKN